MVTRKVSSDCIRPTIDIPRRTSEVNLAQVQTERRVGIQVNTSNPDQRLRYQQTPESSICFAASPRRIKQLRCARLSPVAMVNSSAETCR
jgi:hypothetical protein